MSNLLDDPKLTAKELRARDEIEGLEGPSCHCFDDWDPETEPRPACPHLETADHSLSPEQWAQFQREKLPKEYHDLDIPEGPTYELPGTQEKERVMQERVATGHMACHPDDLRREDMEEHAELRLVNSLGEAKPEKNGRVPSSCRQMVARNAEEPAKEPVKEDRPRKAIEERPCPTCGAEKGERCKGGRVHKRRRKT